MWRVRFLVIIFSFWNRDVGQWKSGMMNFSNQRKCDDMEGDEDSSACVTAVASTAKNEKKPKRTCQG